MNCPPDDDWEEEPAEGESLSDEEKDKEDEEGEEEEKEDEEEDDGFFVGHGVLDKVRKYSRFWIYGPRPDQPKMDPIAEMTNHQCVVIEMTIFPKNLPTNVTI